MNEIETAIDNSIPKSDLSNFGLDQAVLLSLRAFEWRAGVGRRADQFSSANQKACQDAIHFLIRWVFQYSDTNNNQTSTSNQEENDSLFDSLFMNAADYSLVWDLFSQWRGGWLIGHKENDEIILENTPMNIHDSDVADHLLFSPDSPDLAPHPIPGLAELIEEISCTPEASSQFMLNGVLYFRRFAYKLSRAVVRRHITLFEPSIKHLWRFDEKMKLDGYTLGEFRDFWRCLLTICLINRTLCDRSQLVNVIDYGLDNSVFLKARRVWCYDLSNLAGLAISKVQKIIADLTYQPHKANQKMLDVTLQPFIPISGDRLCLSPELITMSNAEDNLWALLNERKSSIISTLKDEKESIWMNELTDFCSMYNLLFLPLKIPEGCGDIDALIVDIPDQFIMAVQLKWHQG
ncbi:MAG TPA: hypothetical protein V6C86_09910 [Oculatellaceae cyanobacterium]